MGIILDVITKILIFIAEITAKIPFSTITVKTPSLVFVILYYMIIFISLKKGSEIIQLVKLHIF